MEKFYSAWRKFRAKEQLKESYKNKLEQLRKNREVLNEVSREAADKIYDWMRDASAMDYSFNDLFDGKMRIAMPFDTEDALNLKKVVAAMKKVGWQPPANPDYDGSIKNFPTKKVKQKRQRLQDEGGGFYEQEIEVADLNLEVSYEKEIPAGPRKGEKIQRTDKLGMGKVLARLVKEKKLDKELLEWWHKRQTYYTKDKNWKEIEELFMDNIVSHTVIISRHPIDVLRMSDVGNITSCHSEGASHWHCAKAEAKGHGPIAYLVPTSDYEKLVAGLYDEGLAADKTPSVKKNIEKAAKHAAQDFIERFYLRFPARTGAIYRSRDDAARVELGIKAIEDEWSVKKAYEDLPGVVKAVLTDQVILDAIIAKEEGKEQPLTKEPEQKKEPEESEELADISKFDDKEIFRDRNRGIKGIVAKGRVRFRKFEDGATGTQFVAPEHRTYGAVPPGFVDSMVKWAAESQKETFKEAGFLVDFRGEHSLAAPDWYDLTRYGGSYEDTNDGAVLSYLFQQYDPEFSAYDEDHNVNSESDEEEDAAQEMWEEWERRVDELNDYAGNNLEHVSCSAMLEEGGGMDGNEPILYASAELEMEIPLTGWTGLESDSENDKFYEPLNNYFEGQPGVEITMIPHSWNPSNWQARNSFESVVDVLEHYVEETEWQVDIDGVRADSRRPADRAEGTEGTVVLTISYRINCDDCGDPDEFEYFVDAMRDDIDAKYEQLREKVRLALVEEEYIARNYFDNMLYPAGWDEELQEPTETPVEMFAGDLKHFKYTEPDGDGEMTFATSEGRSSYISSAMTFPAGLSSRTGADGSATWLDLQNVFGGDRHPHLYQTGVKHTGHGKQAIAQALSDLEAEAKREGERQLAFEFGDEYKKEYSAVLPDFAKDTEMYTIIKSSPEGSHLAFGVQIVVRSIDSEQEIKGALAFVKHIDDNIDRFRKAFESLWKPAIDEALERKRVADEAAVSRDTADELLNALDRYSRTFEDVPPSDPGFNPRSAAAKALILWTNESWDEMNNLERRILISKFLKPILHGPVTADFSPSPRPPSTTPYGWNRRIHDALREGGAGWNVINAYKWEGPSYGELYDAITNPEGWGRLDQAAADTEQPPQETRGGVQQGAPVRATMGEPVPAGAPREPVGLARLGTALDQGGGGPVVRRGDPPEDLREAIRNAINRTIYKQEPQKVSKNSNLKEAIRKAFEESLYSQGGPEDLPSMTPGHPKRDDDEEKEKLKESIRRALKTQLKEWDALQRGLAHLTGQGEEFDYDAKISRESDAGPRIDPRTDTEREATYYPEIEPESYAVDPEQEQVNQLMALGMYDPAPVPSYASAAPTETDGPSFEEQYGVPDPFWGRAPTPQELQYLKFRKNFAGPYSYADTRRAGVDWEGDYDMETLSAEQSEALAGANAKYDALERYVVENHPSKLEALGRPMSEQERRDYYKIYRMFNDTSRDDFVNMQLLQVPQNIYQNPGFEGSPTSHFNPSRLHPVKKTVSAHRGTDFGGSAGAHAGAETTAPLPGKVLRREYQAGGAGNFVEILHVDPNTGMPFVSRYFHLQDESPYKAGDFVEAGDVIGHVGATGIGTGAHAHYEEVGTGGYGRESGQRTYWPWQGADGDVFFDPGDGNLQLASPDYRDIGGRARLTPAQAAGRLDARANYDTGTPEGDLNRKKLAAAIARKNYPDYVNMGQAGVEMLEKITAATEQQLPQRITRRNLQRLVGDDMLMIMNRSPFFEAGDPDRIGRSAFFGQHYDPYEYRLKELNPQEYERRLRLATAAEDILSGGEVPRELRGVSDLDLQKIIDWRDDYLWREEMRETGGFDPSDYTPEQLNRMKASGRFGPLRESKNDSLKSAIREAIKIKLSGKSADCETCGDMHGPEEMCELPTLEEAYIQNVFEAQCSMNIHKQKGGNREETLTDIRGIPGVTIVSVVPGTTRDLPHAFITTLSVKFELNKKVPHRHYIKTVLVPGMHKIPGISNFQVKHVEQISAVEEEV